jgi:hypothetical protein
MATLACSPGCCPACRRARRTTRTRCSAGARCTLPRSSGGSRLWSCCSPHRCERPPPPPAPLLPRRSARGPESSSCWASPGGLQAARCRRVGSFSQESAFAPAAVNAETPTGQTPLHMASANGHDAVVQTLLQHGASVNHRDNQLGYTALHFAASQAHASLVQLLVQFGADGAPTHMARARQAFSSSSLPRSRAMRLPLATVPRAHGADRAPCCRCAVHAADKFGATPLHEASNWSTHASTVAALVSQGADPHRPDGAGETVAAIIARRGLNMSLDGTATSAGADDAPVLIATPVRGEAPSQKPPAVGESSAADGGSGGFGGGYAAPGTPYNADGGGTPRATPPPPAASNREVVSPTPESSPRRGGGGFGEGSGGGGGGLGRQSSGTNFGEGGSVGQQQGYHRPGGVSPPRAGGVTAGGSSSSVTSAVAPSPLRPSGSLEGLGGGTPSRQQGQQQPASAAASTSSVSASPNPDAAAKRAALKAKLERKRQLAAQAKQASAAAAATTVAAAAAGATGSQAVGPPPSGPPPPAGPSPGKIARIPCPALPCPALPCPAPRATPTMSYEIARSVA